MPEILALLALHCGSTIAIIQGYFSNVLMVVCSVINMPRPKKVPRQCQKFWFCERCIVKILQLLYRGILQTF